MSSAATAENTVNDQDVMKISRLYLPVTCDGADRVLSTDITGMKNVVKI